MSNKRRVLLDSETSIMAKKMGDLLGVDPSEAVRFSLWNLLGMFSLEPSSATYVKQELKRIKEEELKNGEKQ